MRNIGAFPENVGELLWWPTFDTKTARDNDDNLKYNLFIALVVEIHKN